MEKNSVKFIRFLSLTALSLFISRCNPESDLSSPRDTEPNEEINYPGVLRSDIYEVTITRNRSREKIAVFKNKCPLFELGEMNMIENDRFPLEIFIGRSISWTNFSFSGDVIVEVRIINPEKVPINGEIKIVPSRHGVSSVVEGNTIRFTLTNPGQYSVEVGINGYKNGLLIFADPPETEIPDQSSGNYFLISNGSKAKLNSLPVSVTGIFFKKGVHDIGVYHIPINIKNIYFEQGSWVYGALIMDGNANVKIFGRGVLSSARLNYRESHCIEAINQSNNIHVEGIVVADPKYFAVRLVGKNNYVSWVKVIGGWVYNCDGISAYEGSSVSNCFIWANDDAMKIYRDNIAWSDIVIWQLNNGGVIQMSWGGSSATNVSIKRVDVLHAEWNKPGFNRALLSCVGNKYQQPGMYGLQRNWLIEDLITETPVQVVFNITPDGYTPNHIHGLTLKNWNVKMKMGTSFQNLIIGNDLDQPFDGFVFDQVVFNGIRLTASNWLAVTEMVTERLETPTFR